MSAQHIMLVDALRDAAEKLERAADRFDLYAQGVSEPALSKLMRASAEYYRAAAVNARAAIAKSEGIADARPLSELIGGTLVECVHCNARVSYGEHHKPGCKAEGK